MMSLLYIYIYIYDHNHIYIDICILTYDWLRSTRIDCSSILLAILTSWCVLDGSTGWWLPWLWKEGENDWYRSFKEKGSRQWLMTGRMTTTMKSNNDVDHVISCHFQPPHREGSRMVSPWTQATSGWWKGMLCHYLLVSQLPAGWHHVFLKDSAAPHNRQLDELLPKCKWTSALGDHLRTWKTAPSQHLSGPMAWKIEEAVRSEDTVLLEKMISVQRSIWI